MFLGYDQPVKQYDSFIIGPYDFHPASGKIELHYSLDDEVSFTETLTFNQPVDTAMVDAATLDRALTMLLIAGGVSYYKTCLPKTILVRRGLTEEQAKFWNTVYEKGLGEFFFRNDIDFRGLINFPHTEKAHAEVPHADVPDIRRVLVPVGGGKDSIVTAELLRRAGHQVTLLRVGEHPIITKLAEEMDMPMLTIKRQLSPALFALNEQGALNGHVPVTAYLSCVSVVTALLTGHTDVALSNERSANEGNVEFHGTEINHQWSKSLEFERMFQQYVSEYVTHEVHYFSLLRPLSELHITKLCSAFESYLPLLTSCNANWKILEKQGSTMWCKKCPKCAFAFALFAAFLPKDRVVQMFGGNLFDDTALDTLYRELLGISGHKPFECVGTVNETQSAFLMIHKRGDFDDTHVMQMFLTEITPPADISLIDDAMTPDSDHAIPAPFDAIIRLHV